MKRIYRTHEIEFDENDFNPWPERIKVDGIELSTENTSKNHGYSWRNVSRGILIYYSAPGGEKIDGGEMFTILNTELRRWAHEEKKKAIPTISEILKKHSLSIAELSRRFDIPYRTVQDWASGLRTPPEYVTKMIVKLLETD